MTGAEALYRVVRDRLLVRPLVLFLDVDGTLAPIVPTPGDAYVPAATRGAIARLAATEGVHVALVSGRAARDARRLVGVEGVWAIGNHGFERITPEGSYETNPAAEPHRPRVAAAAIDASRVAQRHSGVMVEDKEWTLSIHYRQAAGGVEEVLRPALEAIAASHELALTRGKKVFELRPPVDIDKGTASLDLLGSLLGTRDGAVLCAGDDRTDEDAFRALRAARPGAVTIRVAPGTGEAPVASSAEFALPDVEAMGAFLELLAG